MEKNPPQVNISNEDIQIMIRSITDQERKLRGVLLQLEHFPPHLRRIVYLYPDMEDARRRNRTVPTDNEDLKPMVCNSRRSKK